MMKKRKGVVDLTREDQQAHKRDKSTRTSVSITADDDAEHSKKVDSESTTIERCGQPLFVLVETLDCVASKGCISCAHKICAGETLYPHSKPNVRPELCPRASGKSRSSEEWIGLYPEGSVVLTVGDGDLSFSLALARFLGAENVVATTYESRESIIRSYPETGARNIKELEKLNCRIFHGVDANDLQSTLPVRDERFDFVVFNFPCIATEVAGEDGQSEEMAVNQLMLQRFGKGAAQLLKPGGFVHVSHKTKAAFKNWGVATFVCENSGLASLGAVVFDRCVYPGYINRKARDRKSFPASDAVTFVFACHQIPGSFGELETDHLKEGEALKTFVQRLNESQVQTVKMNSALMSAVKRSLIRHGSS